jgi:hypothetical protein
MSGDRTSDEDIINPATVYVQVAFIICVLLKKGVGSVLSQDFQAVLLDPRLVFLVLRAESGSGPSVMVQGAVWY